MYEKVCEVLAEFTKVEMQKIMPEMEIMWDLGMSSCDILDSVIRFEEVFGIAVANSMISTFLTVGDVVEYIEKAIQG